MVAFYSLSSRKPGEYMPFAVLAHAGKELNFGLIADPYARAL